MSIAQQLFYILDLKKMGNILIHVIIFIVAF